MDDFVVRALIGGVGVALVAGPLGCFVVWRRMAYFGETLAHSALLGIALGILLEQSVTAAIIVVCLAVSLILVALQRQRRLPTDTLLGILAHASLAFGLVAAAFLERVRIDLMAYLFGDILAITWGDIVWVYAGGALTIGLLVLLWRQLLMVTIHEDLARVEGVPVGAVRLVLMLLFAVVIAVAMKIVGILLMVSLLVIPAAAARRFSTTPAGMAILASVIGCGSVVMGVMGSLTWDVPAGATIVVAATLVFVATVLIPAGAGGGHAAESS